MPPKHTPHRPTPPRNNVSKHRFDVGQSTALDECPDYAPNFATDSSSPIPKLPLPPYVGGGNGSAPVVAALRTDAVTPYSSQLEVQISDTSSTSTDQPLSIPDSIRTQTQHLHQFREAEESGCMTVAECEVKLPSRSSRTDTRMRSLHALRVRHVPTGGT